MNRDPILIGLTGRAHAGKDSAADHLVREYGFARAAFADALRDMLEVLLVGSGVDYAYLYEPHMKHQPIPELGGITARAMMQTLGTEWGRRHMGPDWWLMLLQRRLGLAGGDTPVHDRLVVTDVRFPNEAAWIRERGGRLIRLQRDQAPGVRPHESESHIDQLPAHVDLVNNGPTLAGLHSLLDAEMAVLGIDRREGCEWL